MKKPTRKIKRNQSSAAPNSSNVRSRKLDSSLISYNSHNLQERSLSSQLRKHPTLNQDFATIPPADSFETFRDSFQRPREGTPELRLKPESEFSRVYNEERGRSFANEYREYASKNFESGYVLDSTVLHNFGIMNAGSLSILPKMQSIHKELRKDFIDVLQEKINLLEQKLARICEESEANVAYLVEKHKEEIEETKMKYKSQMHTANRVIEDLTKELSSPDSKHSSKGLKLDECYLESTLRNQQDKLNQEYQTKVERAKRSLEYEYQDKIRALEDQMKKHKKVDNSSHDGLIREIERSFMEERQNLEDAFNTRLKNLEISYERKIALLQELNKTLKKELKSKATSSTNSKSRISSSFLDDSLNSSMKASTEGLCLRCKAFLKADDELSSIQKKLDSFYYE
jgi:hypothetical protein